MHIYILYLVWPGSEKSIRRNVNAYTGTDADIVFLVVLHRRNNNLEGLLAFFFLRKLFLIVTTSGKTIPKM
jgi:hypothetical protein